MSDGYTPAETSMHIDTPDGDCDETGLFHNEASGPPSGSTRSRRPGLVEWLPRLGPVLWLAGRNNDSARIAQHPHPAVLLDHPSIGALATYRTVRLHQRITPQGPREWLAFDDASSTHQAKLFLLPDSDFLAWDQMCAALRLEQGVSSDPERASHSSFLRRALARLGNRGQAHLLQFGLRKKPWLTVLAAHPPLRISLLAIDIVRSIAQDEHAEWISPMHRT